LNDHIDLGMVNGFGIISLMGPALAAMIVSAVLRSEPSGVRAGKRWRLFGILSILALAVMAVVRLWHAAGLVTVFGISATPVPYPTLTAFLMDVMAAVGVAFVLSGVYSPRQGVRDLLHSLDPRTQPVHWYGWVLALGFYPAVVALGNAISAGVGLPASAPNTTGPWHWLALNALIMFPYFVFGGGGLEEIGWRGFALPWLQKQYSPLRSSLILAVLWAFWHWPFLKGGLLGMVVYLLLMVAPLAILFTAVFNWTGGSLPIAILLHASINLTDQYLPASRLATGLWMLLILVIALWMWRSPQAFSFSNQDLLHIPAAR
jgi:membrane protease YdiL (CAAX protease family)